MLLEKTPKGLSFISENTEPKDGTVKERNGAVTFWPEGKPWAVDFKCDGEVVTVASGNNVDAVKVRTRVAAVSETPVEQVVEGR